MIANRQRYPFHRLVEGQYSLEQLHIAMSDAANHRVLRAAITPLHSTPDTP